MTPKIADFIKLLWFVNISYDVIEMGLPCFSIFFNKVIK